MPQIVLTAPFGGVIGNVTRINRDGTRITLVVWNRCKPAFGDSDGGTTAGTPPPPHPPPRRAANSSALINSPPAGRKLHESAAPADGDSAAAALSEVVAATAVRAKDSGRPVGPFAGSVVPRAAFVSATSAAAGSTWAPGDQSSRISRMKAALLGGAGQAQSPAERFFRAGSAIPGSSDSQQQQRAAVPAQGGTRVQEEGDRSKRSARRMDLVSDPISPSACCSGATRACHNANTRSV